MESYLLTLGKFLQDQLKHDQCSAYFAELQPLVDQKQWLQMTYAYRAGLKVLFAIHTREQFSYFLTLFNKHQYNDIADKADTMEEADLKEISVFFADVANFTYPFSSSGGSRMVVSKNGRTFLSSMQDRKQRVEPITLLPLSLQTLPDDLIYEMFSVAPHLFSRSAGTVQKESRESLTRLFKQSMDTFNRAMVDETYSSKKFLALAKEMANKITGDDVVMLGPSQPIARRGPSPISTPQPIARRGPSSKTIVTFKVVAILEWSSHAFGIILSSAPRSMLFYMKQYALKHDEDNEGLLEQFAKAPMYKVRRRPKKSTHKEPEYTLYTNDQAEKPYLVGSVDQELVAFRMTECQKDMYEHVKSCKPVTSIHKAEVAVRKAEDGVL